MEVVVLGCGGIGLPFAVALASRGTRVVGVDTDAALVRRASEGHTDLLDPGLEPALTGALAEGVIGFVVAAPRSYAPRAFVIAVPTPLDGLARFDGGPVAEAMSAILAVASPGDLVMVRSTVPIGLTRTLAAGAAGRALLFACCPDRSVSGAAFAEQFSVPNPVGGLDDAAARAAAEVLAPLGEVVALSSPEAAEALKLIANAWRDARFAIANQFAMICEQAGLDFEEVRAAGARGFARADIPRAGPVGGPCLGKDVGLLAGSAAGGAALLVAARALNHDVIERAAKTTVALVAADRRPARILVAGLAFKGRPATRDRRGSPGVALLERLRSLLPQAAIAGWDPAGAPGEGAAAAKGATAVLLANDHPDLAAAAWLEGCVEGALVYDLCGALDGPVRSDLRVVRFGRGTRS